MDIETEVVAMFYWLRGVAKRYIILLLLKATTNVALAGFLVFFLGGQLRRQLISPTD